VPSEQKVIYWHGELPPLDAESVGEHIVEAASGRVKEPLGHGGEVWDRCHQDLMSRARERLEQEVARLGGQYAHVLGESIQSHHDDAAGEAWLEGRFDYLLLRRPGAP
jgi:hypothetical protein